MAVGYARRGEDAVALVLAMAGAVCIALPDPVLARFADLSAPPLAAPWLVRGFGFALLALALVPGRARPMAGLRAGLAVAALVLAYAGFAMVLSDWWIDDAGITFSYARTLSEGGGITFQPGEPASEGYSSTLWMGMLAAIGWAGGDIAVAAKLGGLLAGGAVLLLVCAMVWAQMRSPAGVVLAGIAVLAAPFVIWAASGQEHAVQALLLLAVVALAGRGARWPVLAGLVLALLVLTRPETPLIVAAVVAAVLIHDRRILGHWWIGRALPLALIPFAAFLGLLAFRIWYFGEAFPNPYHAKAGESGFAGLLNPFGGGWQYLLQGTLQTGLVVLVALLFLGFGPVPSIRVAVLVAVAGGHLVFVLWAKGDWMGGWRFLMPVIPLLAVAAGFALAALPQARRRGFAVVAGLGLAVANLGVLDRFAGAPTTPLATVGAIGAEFAALGARLGIADPLLAHHDAGAIAYLRPLRLVDLGGLVDPFIARNMTDREALIGYIVDRRRPDFVFGARNFAAASGFHESPEFAAAYVALEFPASPLMQADLAYLRRDRLPQTPPPGLEPRTDPDGTLAALHVLAH